MLSMKQHTATFKFPGECCTAQKWTFSLRISSVNVTDPLETAYLVTCTEEILLCSVVSVMRYF